MSQIKLDAGVKENVWDAGEMMQLSLMINIQWMYVKQQMKYSINLVSVEVMQDVSKKVQISILQIGRIWQMDAQKKKLSLIFWLQR